MIIQKKRIFRGDTVFTITLEKSEEAFFVLFEKQFKKRGVYANEQKFFNQTQAEEAFEQLKKLSF